MSIKKKLKQCKWQELEHRLNTGPCSDGIMLSAELLYISWIGHSLDQRERITNQSNYQSSIQCQKSIEVHNYVYMISQPFKQPFELSFYEHSAGTSRGRSKLKE